ncbi:MAG: hypothetical protein WKF77_01760 [Planctomycetaceae bacterium]
MPVVVHADIRHLDQREFGQVAFSVMSHVFALQRDLGRFFDEEIYRDALAVRWPGAQTEVRIEIDDAVTNL